jgi:hypothetical protein
MSAKRQVTIGRSGGASSRRRSGASSDHRSHAGRPAAWSRAIRCSDSSCPRPMRSLASGSAGTEEAAALPCRAYTGGRGPICARLLCRPATRRDPSSRLARCAARRLPDRRSQGQERGGHWPPAPDPEPLRPVLLGAFIQQGRRGTGPVSAVSVVSGKLATRARENWAAAGLESITLHECRHTYASFLMTAGHTLRELMEYIAAGDRALRQAAAAARRERSRGEAERLSAAPSCRLNGAASDGKAAREVGQVRVAQVADALAGTPRR